MNKGYKEGQMLMSAPHTLPHPTFKMKGAEAFQGAAFSFDFLEKKHSWQVLGRGCPLARTKLNSSRLAAYVRVYVKHLIHSSSHKMSQISASRVAISRVCVVNFKNVPPHFAHM